MHGRVLAPLHVSRANFNFRGFFVREAVRPTGLTVEIEAQCDGPDAMAFHNPTNASEGKCKGTMVKALHAHLVLEQTSFDKPALKVMRMVDTDGQKLTFDPVRYGRQPLGLSLPIGPIGSAS